MSEEVDGPYERDLPPLRSGPLPDAEPVDLDKLVPRHGDPFAEPVDAPGSGAGGGVDPPGAATAFADALPPDDSELAPGNDRVDNP